MPRFILIDHSIIDQGGHYLEYAQNVLEAAKVKKYDTWLATNLAYTNKTELSVDKLLRLYKYDTWGKRAEVSQDIFMQESEALSGSNHFSAKRKNGLKLVTREFLHKRYHQIRKPFVVKSFIHATSRLLAEAQIDSGDIIFIPTLSVNDLYAVYQVLSQNDYAAKCTWHLLMRRNIFKGKPSNYSAEDKALLPLKRILKKLSHYKQVYFYTDTKELTEQYSLLDIVPFYELPIPINKTIIPVERPTEKPIAITYLGDARLEKGFQYLPYVVKSLCQEAEIVNHIRFLIQANFGFTNSKGNEQVIVARKNLENLRDRVILFKECLSSEKYCNLIQDTSIALFMYDNDSYYARSSGAFAECLAAGIPVIVPDMTWMAAQLPKVNGKSSFGVCYRDISEVPYALLDIIKNYRLHSDKAKAFSNEWRAINNPEQLVNLIERRI